MSEVPGWNNEHSAQTSLSDTAIDGGMERGDHAAAQHALVALPASGTINLMRPWRQQGIVRSVETRCAKSPGHEAGA